MPEAWRQWEGQVAGEGFHLRRYLGGTDRSAVFLTEFDEEGSRKAAIKLILAEPENAKAQVALWERVAELSHPHVMRPYGIGNCRIQQAELLYVVMEFAEEHLSEVILQRPLSGGEASAMLGPVVDALAYLHSQGWVHGSLKPSNILSVGDQLKISSDGLWRIGESRASLWKPGPYDPPGLPGRRLSAAGDIWALGVTLVESLTQRVPAWNPGEPMLRETLPEPFHDVALHCLKPNPQDRWTLREISARLGLPPSASSGFEALRHEKSAKWWNPAVLWRPQCPTCRSRAITRSRRRNMVEKVLSAIILPYRCGRCGARFFQFRQKTANEGNAGIQP